METMIPAIGVVGGPIGLSLAVNQEHAIAVSTNVPNLDPA
jgi:hypothetical protein